ncbi:hypothetical protein TIFTF001_000597 [Ficus carica]|uniref:Uncharacterized protein n=1 Tax=Ficus carica TaxID=3494 RepID=A0AA88CPD7_FICCA|nr:hypothetical protein TIFTF001_000597 [Ficus carica]
MAAGDIQTTFSYKREQNAVERGGGDGGTLMWRIPLQHLALSVGKSLGFS